MRSKILKGHMCQKTISFDLTLMNFKTNPCEAKVVVNCLGYIKDFSVRWYHQQEAVQTLIDQISSKVRENSYHKLNYTSLIFLNIMMGQLLNLSDEKFLPLIRKNLAIIGNFYRYFSLESYNWVRESIKFFKS